MVFSFQLIEAEPVENGVNGVNGVNGDHVPNGVDDEQMDESEKQIKPEKPAHHRQIKVTYEEYKTIANLLILHLRQVEEASAGEKHNVCVLLCMVYMYARCNGCIGYSCESDDAGTRQNDLVNWYLKEVEADIESIKELSEKKVLVEKVIDRLVHHVSLEQTVIL